MLEFLNAFHLVDSFAVIALLGISLPLLIHLLHTHRGKILAVGNIEFFRHIHRAHHDQLKLNQWLLLVLRVLLVVLTAFVAGQLVMMRPLVVVDETHVYLSPRWLLDASRDDIDALHKRHVDDRLFLLQQTTQAIEYSELEAKKKALQNNTGQLFSDFVSLSELTPQQLSVKQLIVYLSARYQSLPASEVHALAENIELRVLPLNGSPLTTALNILVLYDASRIDDANIIQAAFAALPKPLATKFLSTSSAISDLLDQMENKAENTGKLAEVPRYDSLIWLADSDFPERLESLLAPSGILIRDAAVELATIASINNRRNLTQSLVVQSPVAGRQLISFYHSPLATFAESGSAVAETSRPRWRDARGQVWLSERQHKTYTRIQLHSRFHPQWTSLVTEPQFPLLLADIIFEHAQVNVSPQLNPGEIEQFSSHNKSGASTSSEHRLTGKQSALPWLALAIALLWCAERYIAERGLRLLAIKQAVAKPGQVSHAR